MKYLKIVCILQNVVVVLRKIPKTHVYTWFHLQEAIKENEEEPEMTVNTSAGSVTGMARVSSNFFSYLYMNLRIFYKYE